MLRLNYKSFFRMCSFCAVVVMTLAMPGVCFGQNGNSDYGDDSDYASEDERDIKALEGQLSDFQKTQEKLVKDMNPEQAKLNYKLQKAIEGGDQRQIKALTQKLTKSFQGNSMSPAHMSSMVNMVLKQFQTMSEAQLRAHLLERTGDNPVGVLFSKYPKILGYLVRVLRDPLALPQFFSILTQKTKLIIFFGLNVLLFILKFFVKRAHKNANVTISTHFRRSIFFFSARVFLLFAFFHTEIGPFFFIAKDIFL